MSQKIADEMRELVEVINNHVVMGILDNFMDRWKDNPTDKNFTNVGLASILFACKLESNVKHGRDIASQDDESCMYQMKDMIAKMKSNDVRQDATTGFNYSDLFKDVHKDYQNKHEGEEGKNLEMIDMICPHCFSNQDINREKISEQVVSPGDFMMCTVCMELSKVTHGMKLQKMTAFEHRILMADIGDQLQTAKDMIKMQLDRKPNQQGRVVFKMKG